MSRATISTDKVTFDFSDKQKINNHASGDACHIVILADFSGRDHRGLNNLDSIIKRKIIQIDRDNFDQVFSQMDVQCSLPLADESLCFKELDEMHPDFIYAHVPLFNHLRALKRKLKSPASFVEAAEEIYQWHRELAENKAPSSAARPAQNFEKEVNDLDVSSLLDNILTNANDNTGTSASERPKFDIQALVKDIIAPYVLPKPDPRLEELLQTVDDATSELMRKIMHNQNFQNIEAAWRGLSLLVRRIETDQNLKIFIADISQQEVIDDSLTNKGVEQTNLYKLLVDNQTSTGSIPFKIIMHDASFGHTSKDINGLGHLGKIAQTSGAIVISSATEQLAGCESLAKTPEKDDWDLSQKPEIIDCWNSLRSSAEANNILVVAPRYLARMLYGKKSAPIESFNYEELPQVDKHSYYLWGSGGWLVILLMAQNYSANANLLSLKENEIDRLPLHVFYNDDEASVTPCAEINMLDSTSIALREVGITTIRSILNKDSVLIANLLSIKN